MIDDNNISVSDLCVIQFREPLEYIMYPEQLDMYIPKIWNQELNVQVLISTALFSGSPLYLTIYNDKGYKIGRRLFSKYTLSAGYYYAEAIFLASDIALLNEDEVVYFSIENTLSNNINNDATTTYASSLWYKINPSYTGDLKNITYSHGSNDWNTIFLPSKEFTLTVECGFIPDDSKDEQDVDDFSEQNMVNQTVFGDEYEIIGLTVGDSVSGIPNWLRKKISRCSLCDTLKVANVRYNRTSGSKMEKIEKTRNGLGIYKLDLQTIKNYLQ